MLLAIPVKGVVSWEYLILILTLTCFSESYQSADDCFFQLCLCSGAALRATRSIRCANQACSLGPSGDDQERLRMSGIF
jgi:hypothetical protein